MPVSTDRDFSRMAAPVLERVASDPALGPFRRLSTSELEALIYCILRHFTLWSQGANHQTSISISLLRNICFIRSIHPRDASNLIYTIRDCVQAEVRLD